MVLLLVLLLAMVDMAAAAPAHRAPPKPSPPGRRGCQHGSASASSLDAEAGAGRLGVINGEVVEGFPYPWLTWLGDEGSGQFCGGTLIAPDWVLTAAHCLWATLPLPPSPDAILAQVHRRDYSLPIGDEAPAVRGARGARGCTLTFSTTIQSPYIILMMGHPLQSQPTHQGC
jgi:hypothetical protein